jgi:hypothetical protein
MAGETNQTLLAAGDAAASNAKAAFAVESDTAPPSSSSNAATQKIAKKNVPMLQDYWKKSTVIKADHAVYHAAD